VVEKEEEKKGKGKGEKTDSKGIHRKQVSDRNGIPKYNKNRGESPMSHLSRSSRDSEKNRERFTTEVPHKKKKESSVDHTEGKLLMKGGISTNENNDGSGNFLKSNRREKPSHFSVQLSEREKKEGKEAGQSRRDRTGTHASGRKDGRGKNKRMEV